MWRVTFHVPVWGCLLYAWPYAVLSMAPFNRSIVQSAMQGRHAGSHGALHGALPPCARCFPHHPQLLLLLQFLQHLHTYTHPNNLFTYKHTQTTSSHATNLFTSTPKLPLHTHPNNIFTPKQLCHTHATSCTISSQSSPSFTLASISGH
jgi:hypothetical protein